MPVCSCINNKKRRLLLSSISVVVSCGIRPSADRVLGDLHT